MAEQKFYGFSNWETGQLGLLLANVHPLYCWSQGLAQQLRTPTALAHELQVTYENRVDSLLATDVTHDPWVEAILRTSLDRVHWLELAEDLLDET